jgi:hypothetical protein
LTRRIMARFHLRSLRDAEDIAEMVLSGRTTAAARCLNKWTHWGRARAFDALLDLRRQSGAP